MTADKAVKNKSTGNMELIWNVVKVVDVRHNDEGEREYRLRCVNLPPKFDFWTDDYDGVKLAIKILLRIKLKYKIFSMENRLPIFG